MFINYFIIGVFVFFIALLIRTSSINKASSNHAKSINIVKYVFIFLAREFRTVLILYTSSIGIYIVIERMIKYRIYPATEQGIYNSLKSIQHMEANLFVSKIFFLMLTMYIVLILPYKLLKLYSTIINENNYKDYLQIACNKLFSVIEAIPKTTNENDEKKKK